jgi:alpha-beta hydrolase superfamily lysophospholipase
VSEPVELAGGARAMAWRAARPAATRHAVVALHGMMSHAGWFDGLGGVLAGRGVELLALDRRGSGRARGSAGATDPEAWLADVRAAVAHARRQADTVTLLCWCWGARSGLPIAAEGDGVDRVIVAAPALFLLPSVVDRMVHVTPDANGEVELPYDPLDDFSFDPAVRAFIEHDPLRWRRAPLAFLEPSRALGVRALAALERVRRPLLCLLASEDRLVDGVATRAAFAGFAVEEIPGAHAFVLERPAAIAERLIGFAAQSSGGAK